MQLNKKIIKKENKLLFFILIVQIRRINYPNCSGHPVSGKLLCRAGHNYVAAVTVVFWFCTASASARGSKLKK